MATGALLIATRINGPVTLVVAGATADVTSLGKPGIETAGLITDIGCAIQRDGIQLTDEQAREIASYGLGPEWTSSAVCQWTDALYGLGTFDGQRVASDRLAVVSLWWSVLQDHPGEVVSARMLRLNSQLPLPMTGIPRPAALHPVHHHAQRPRHRVGQSRGV